MKLWEGSVLASVGLAVLACADEPGRVPTGTATNPITIGGTAMGSDSGSADTGDGDTGNADDTGTSSGGSNCDETCEGECIADQCCPLEQACSELC